MKYKILNLILIIKTTLIFTIVMLISINTFAQKYKDYLDSAELKFSQEKYFDAYEFYKAAKVYGKNIPSIVAKSEEGMEEAIVAIKRQKEISDSLYIVANEEKIKTEKALNKADSALVVTNNFLSYMSFYKDKYALAYNGSKFGYVNKNGDIMIDFFFNSAEPFDENTGYARVSMRGYKGYDYYYIDTLNNQFLLAEDWSELEEQTTFQIINLSYNSSKKLSHLGKQKTAEYLNLEGYKFKLDKNIGKLTNLEVLKLNESYFKSIPSVIGNLKNLKNLELHSSNNLKTLPKEIGNLTNLNKLDLSISQVLESLPKELGNLTNLEELILGECYNLLYIPEEIGNLQNLKYLNLSSGNYIPYNLKNLKNLMLLNLSSFSIYDASINILPFIFQNYDRDIILTTNYDTINYDHSKLVIVVDYIDTTFYKNNKFSKPQELNFYDIYSPNNILKIIDYAKCDYILTIGEPYYFFIDEYYMNLNSINTASNYLKYDDDYGQFMLDASTYFPDYYYVSFPYLDNYKKKFELNENVKILNIENTTLNIKKFRAIGFKL